MKQQTSNRAGYVLISLGILAIVGQFLGFGLNLIPAFLGRFWALLPLAGGLVFMGVPMLYPNNRGLGGMFIPGAVLTTNGLMLTASSLFGWWDLWSWAWPLQFLGLATGFTLAGMRLKVPELLIPASIMFVNWALFQFSTLTGLWHFWAYFWPLEIGAVSLGLLLVGMIKRNNGLRKSGLIVGTVSIVFLFLMLLIGATSLLTLSTGGLLVALGLVMLGWNMMGGNNVATVPAGTTPATKLPDTDDDMDYDVVIKEKELSSL